jgi:CRP/FNR family transcriptional regulator, cyclic AMP receptor protein
MGTFDLQVPMLGRGYREWAAPADWAEVLSSFPVFEGIGKRKLRRLVRDATVTEYGRGDFVIQKGTAGDSLYVILSGAAMALGKPASRTLRTGDYFGELSLLDGTPRSATIVATSELHVMRLPRRSFIELVEHNGGISLKMLSTLAGQIRGLEARPVHVTE